jgi:hypothetical protein
MASILRGVFRAGNLKRGVTINGDVLAIAFVATALAPAGM